MEKTVINIKGIKVELLDRVVRVENGKALKALLKPGKRSAAMALARTVRRAYEKKAGTALDITEKSLAAEIYDHYLLQEMTLFTEKLFGQSRPTRWMIRHMEVIDCGEKSEDNNRFLWDWASKLW